MTTIDAKNGDVRTLTHQEAMRILEKTARSNLGVNAEQAMDMARRGALPDDLRGSTVRSWVRLVIGGMRRSA